MKPYGSNIRPRHVCGWGCCHSDTKYLTHSGLSSSFKKRAKKAAKSSARFKIKKLIRTLR